MSKPITIYSQPSYEGLRSSNEVLKAIEEITGHSVLDQGSAAYKAWSAPSPDQYDKIYTRAWQLADNDTEELYWGEAKLIADKTLDWLDLWSAIPKK